MIIWGITALTHDASITVLDGSKILYAAHSERFSGKKFDPLLNEAIIAEALSYGTPEAIAFYENPWKKKLRQLWHGQWSYAADFSKMPELHLSQFGLNQPITYVDHHLSHAAAGYYTSGWSEAAVLVIDAVGEFQTCTIWDVVYGRFVLKHEIKYPHSIGLLYSAFTRRCGLKPNDEEYIMMGMAAFGEPIYVDRIKEEFDYRRSDSSHGISDWIQEAKPEDLAASIQKVCEYEVLELAELTSQLTGRKHLVYMGGVALNCMVNTVLQQSNLFDDIWIMPNPGDAGSSLGCAAFIQNKMLSWEGPYLGTEIDREYPVVQAKAELLSSGIVGVANGRAEFGPRALGNRSLLADPRKPENKDLVNVTKQRQKFRPFAPVVLEEYVTDWFETNRRSPYMQYVYKCKRPDDIPAVCHVDGTCRIQTVNRHQHPGLYELVKEFYNSTGCPVLLNTSLNIRGKPIVNDLNDVKEFETKYNVKVTT